MRTLLENIKNMIALNHPMLCIAALFVVCIIFIELVFLVGYALKD